MTWPICGAKWDRYTCKLSPGHAGKHQDGTVTW